MLGPERVHDRPILLFFSEFVLQFVFFSCGIVSLCASLPPRFTGNVRRRKLGTGIGVAPSVAPSETGNTGQIAVGVTTRWSLRWCIAVTTRVHGQGLGRSTESGGMGMNAAAFGLDQSRKKGRSLRVVIASFFRHGGTPGRDSRNGRWIA